MKIQITVTEAKQLGEKKSTWKMKRSYTLPGECYFFDRFSPLLVQYITYCCIYLSELMKHTESGDLKQLKVQQESGFTGLIYSE